MSKTKICTLNKTKQKDTLISARHSPCRPGNSGLREQGVAQTEGCLWDKKLFGFFHLIGLLIWIRITESGEQEGVC